MYTESRKMVLNNLFTGQQWRNRTDYGHGERGGEGEIYGKSNMETYIAICKIDNQWEFAECLRHLLAILIPACESSSPEFQNVYSA